MESVLGNQRTKTFEPRGPIMTIGSNQLGINRHGFTPFALVGILSTLFFTHSAFADELVLRTGGKLRGELLEVEGDPDSVKLYTATAVKPLVIKRERFREIIPIDTILDDYLKRLKTLVDSAEAHYELGLWSEENDLKGPARRHYQTAIELDDSFGPAHEKLGHVFFGGTWMNKTEVRRAQGLVQHEGRWITPERKAELDASAARGERHDSWQRQIDLLVKKYYQGSPSDREEAREQLEAIRDPEAVLPLVNRLGHEVPQLRLLLADILPRIEETIATEGLVHRVANEPDDQIRTRTLNALARRRDPEAGTYLMQKLESKDPNVVGRVAGALAGLNIVESVPNLVPKLVSLQRRVETVLVPSGGGDGGGMNINARFNSIGSNGFGQTNRSVAVITETKAAPGAVAFGVASVPISQYYQGIGLTVGSQASRPVPRQVVRPYYQPNVEVLSALQQLTGENFGYDIQTWQRWIRAEFRLPEPEVRAERQIPQP